MRISGTMYMRAMHRSTWGVNTARRPFIETLRLRGFGDEAYLRLVASAVRRSHLYASGSYTPKTVVLNPRQCEPRASPSATGIGRGGREGAGESESTGRAERTPERRSLRAGARTAGPVKALTEEYSTLSRTRRGSRLN